MRVATIILKLVLAALFLVFVYQWAKFCLALWKYFMLGIMYGG